MITRQPLCAVVTLLLLPSWSWAADKPAAQPGKPAAGEASFDDMLQRTNGDPVLVTEAERYSEWDFRFGWWAFWNNGSPQKVGEYQALKPSPFWDADGFSSDGTRTVGITATGTDNETTYAKVYFFQNNLTATLDYERFLHRLDHDPLKDMPNLFQPFPPFPDGRSLPNNPGGNDPLVMKQDINVGRDYAIRVQEFKSTIKWVATDNFRARVDVWGMEKEGTRQNNSTAMCYNRNVLAFPNLPPDHLGPGGTDLGTFAGGRCHVLSQAQHIDWTTTEIKPVFELRLGDSFVIEYSRPMRGFTADDQRATRFYDVTGVLTYNALTSNNPPLNPPNANPYPTGVVPNNYTEMDQIKIRGKLTDDTTAYAFLMAGHTVNQEIDMTRWFNDADIRLTNTSIENVTLTGYGRVFNETESMPSLTAVTALETYNNTRTPNFQPELDAPIGYHKSTGGLKGVWRVRGNGFDRGGLALLAGYEYNDLERTNAIFATDTGNVTLDDSRTITHGFQVGPDYRWSSTLDTYVRYKYQNADQPLIGFKPIDSNGLSNTLLPQHDHVVEFGFNWVPAEWFILNACLGVETSDTHGSFTTGDTRPPTIFSEQNYPMSISAWYAASDRLSFSAGYAVYSNFVAQDISVGDDGPGSLISPVTGRWRYGGRAHVVTLGSRYAATDRVTLTGQLEWVRGQDLINDSTMVFPAVAPATTPTTVTTLGTFSQVLNETTRLTMGADWMVRPRVVTYVRYELYNFNDVAPGYQTGLAQGVLGGLSALF